LTIDGQGTGKIELTDCILTIGAKVRAIARLRQNCRWTATSSRWLTADLSTARSREQSSGE